MEMILTTLAQVQAFSALGIGIMVGLAALGAQAARRRSG